MARGDERNNFLTEFNVQTTVEEAKFVYLAERIQE
jgi:hypothetical protein